MLIADGTSLADSAQPLGAPLSSIIEFGDQYNGGDELYDAKITVMQVVRGEKAWDLVKRADAANALPKNGYEYLLARVHFDFAARTSPSHYNYTIAARQFVATMADGSPYDSPVLASSVQPALSATLKPGDSAEGWVVFVVPRSDRGR